MTRQGMASPTGIGSTPSSRLCHSCGRRNPGTVGRGTAWRMDSRFRGNDERGWVSASGIRQNPSSRPSPPCTASAHVTTLSYGLGRIRARVGTCRPEAQPKDLGIGREVSPGRRPDPSLRYASFRMTQPAQASIRIRIIPAKAGIHRSRFATCPRNTKWIPANAGMTIQGLREGLLHASDYGHAP